MADKLTLFQYPVDDSPYEIALTLGRSLPTEKDGVPCRYYWKEMLQLGRIVDVNGNEHDVTSEHLDQVVSDYKKVSAKGHQAYLPLAYHPNPKDSSTPTDPKIVKTENKGFLIDVQRRGDSLHGLHQFIGSEDEIKKTVALNDSSIGILKNVRASDGEIYKTFIDHNAILPDPQLFGLGGFVPVDAGNTLSLAASRGAVVEQVVLKKQGDRMQTLTPEHVTKIKALVAQKDPKVTVTDGNAIEMLLGFAQDPPKPGEAVLLSREQLTAAQKATGKADLSQNDAAAALLETLTAEQTKTLTLSRDLETATKAKTDADALLLSRTPAELSEDTAHERALRVDQGLETLGHIGYAPDFIKDLKPVLVGSADKYDTLMLSRSSSDKTVDIRAMQVVNVLKKHKDAIAGPALGVYAVNKDKHIMLGRETGTADSGGAGDIGRTVAEHYNSTVSPVAAKS